ncbi:MAG: metal-binding protein [Bacteroidetes bacterium CG_4_9_14_3_um_filter_41_19]|nr:MAG: metal-binding protein [Bacteroidetes bacterium CG_4_9_14_3_um_filter_41_19]
MIEENEIDHLLNTSGFDDFKWINPKEIVVSQWVRVKCEFGCGDYGLGACPPNTPSVQGCKDFFHEYDKGIIIRLSTMANKENYPSEWSKEMTGKLLNLEREIFLSGYHKAFLLNQTCCDSCKDCPGNRVNCKDKKKSRPSPEGFAVDVYQTVRKFGLKINVITKNPSEINRIAILLIE